MSGICGIVSLDVPAPTETDIRRLTAALEQRGPDGTHIWLNGKVALGHTLLATTPEALVEHLPLSHSETGCTITADARLDNREELFEKLRQQQAGRVIGDGELILLAYLEWGEACLDHLMGDFAFAIWDPRACWLFCARDQVGMRQLIYFHQPGKLFVFATEPRAIIQHRGVPQRINEERVVDYFIGNSAGDLTSTFYAEVFRLPPAHKLTLVEGTLQIKRYWHLPKRVELQLESDQEYAQAFLSIFTDAVRCRLRGPATVGAMLSGGMDSNSVVAVASKLLNQAGTGPLATISAVGDQPETCTETRAVLVAATAPGLRPHFIRLSELDGLGKRLAEHAAEIAEPFDGPMTLPRAVYLKSQEAGLKAVLDGVSGDIVFDAANQLTGLIKRGQWLQAYQEAIGQEHFWGSTWPAWKPLLRSSWQALIPLWLRNGRKWALQGRRSRKAVRASLIDPNLAERGNFEARLAALEASISIDDLPEAAARAKVLTHPHNVLGRESYDRIASAFAIEPRDPFCDLRVIEFCYSLPMSQLERNGWPKFLLRMAMVDLVPDSIRWRRGKEHLGWSFNERFLQVPDIGPTNMSTLLDDLRTYVDSERGIKELGNLGADRALEKLSFLLYFRYWLDRSGIE